MRTPSTSTIAGSAEAAAADVSGKAPARGLDPSGCEPQGRIGGDPVVGAASAPLPSQATVRYGRVRLRQEREMDVIDLHFELHVRDLEAARRFYVDQLGLPVLQETAAMSLLAVRVGKSRMSIFGNRTDGGEAGPSQIILAVADIDQTVAEMEAKGIVVSGRPVTAGTFLRFVTTCDPEGNTVAVSQYLRDPIVSI